MIATDYIHQLENILAGIATRQATQIAAAGELAARALSAGGVIHTFGTGHSHMIAEEAFYRAGGLAAVNPILDERLLFLKGALESTDAERESGYARAVLEREDVRAGDAAIIISNSGRNAVPIEMAIEMKTRGVSVIAITNLEQSRASAARHPLGKRLFELADVAVDNSVPPGDALMTLPGLDYPVGASSTVACAAIMNAILLTAMEELIGRGEKPAVLPSANAGDESDRVLRAALGRYKDRVRLIDVP